MVGDWISAGVDGGQPTSWHRVGSGEAANSAVLTFEVSGPFFYNPRLLRPTCVNLACLRPISWKTSELFPAVLSNVAMNKRLFPDVGMCPIVTKRNQGMGVLTYLLPNFSNIWTLLVTKDDRLWACNYCSKVKHVPMGPRHPFLTTVTAPFCTHKATSPARSHPHQLWLSTLCDHHSDIGCDAVSHCGFDLHHPNS